MPGTFTAGKLPAGIAVCGRLISRKILSVPQYGGVSQLLGVGMGKVGKVWAGGGIDFRLMKRRAGFASEIRPQPEDLLLGKVGVRG